MILNKRFIFLLFVLVFVIPFDINAQISGIPPAMLEQFKNMPPAEQRKMAQQYGINTRELGQLADSSTLSILGNQADETEPQDDQRLLQRLIREKEFNERKKYTKNEELSIFEREYNDAMALPIYGQFLFDDEVTTYAPVDNAPVPDNYRIGVGDSLNILLYGTENDELELIVDRNGNINFPKLGNLSIAGMSFGEIREYINRSVLEQMIGVNVSISMGRLRSINVFMAGEAKVPGNYSVSALSTVSQMLFVAGGPSEIGSLRDIQVLESGKKKSTFDVYKLLTEGNTDGDVRLKSGDVVFIPPSEKVVIIDGAVKRPGRYELIENETIDDLILLAGGLDNRAHLKKALLERYNPNDDFPLTVNLDLSDDQSNYLLQDGDVLRIASVKNLAGNSILLKGAVQHPGKYGWIKGLRLTDIVKSFDQDLIAETDTLRSLIVRRKSKDDQSLTTLDFSLLKAITNPKSEFDPFLQSHDEILIFSKVDEKLEKELSQNEIYQNPTISSEELFLNSQEGTSFPNNRNQDAILLDNNTNRILRGSQVQLDKNNNFLTQEQMSLNNSLTDYESNNFLSFSDQERRDRLEAKEQDYEESKKMKKMSRREILKPILKRLRQQANEDESVQIVSISGAVKSPGEYPLTRNATYFNLLELAGGFTDDAFTDRAELRRIQVTVDGPAMVNLSEIIFKDTLSSNILLSRDHIRVNKIKDWNISDMVEIKGEVVYPGEYLISSNEALSSVIERAGGFTKESFINAASFTRDSVKQKEREQLLVLGNNIRRDQASRSMTKESIDYTLTSSEVEEGIQALLSTEVMGRLIIDLPRLLSGDVTADIVLQDGDILDIPKFTNAVTVVGEVRRPGSFVRQESYMLDDYIELAAGMTARGNKKQIYVIRANGSVDQLLSNTSSRFLQFSDINDNILAGDTIVIPIKSSYQTPLNLYQTVSQVVFQSIASIAAFSTILN
jgi:protein involved in polysaccharide export with SLBB domain